MAKIKQKEIKSLISDIESLLIYLDAPNSPFGPRGDGAKNAFCVEVYHLFKNINRRLNILENKLLNHYGHDMKSVQLIDYYDEED